MPNWKKLIVSGSDASLNSLSVTTNVIAQSFTGSFSGSLTAPGATTQVVYNSGGTLAASSNFVFSGSNVGIGTTAPDAKLQIINPDGGSYRFGYGGSSDVYFDADIVYFRTDNGGANLMTSTTSGLGIGTVSPTQKLDVAGAISVSGSVIDYEVAPGLIGAGPSTNIISFTPGTHYAAFVDYVIKDSSTGANQRVGTIMVSISLAGASAVMNEVATVDIGNTSAITFSVTYGAPTWLVAANSGITPYDINYMVRYF